MFKYKYSAYGEVTVLSPDEQTARADSAYGNRLQYTGREYDRETGLNYYRARYYHPQLGRFTSTDPIGGDGLLNLYTYVSNSPVNFIDAFGWAKNPPVQTYSAKDPMFGKFEPLKVYPAPAEWNKQCQIEGAERETTENILVTVRARILDLMRFGYTDTTEYGNLIEVYNWLLKIRIQETAEWKKEEITQKITYADRLIEEIIGLYGATWEELAEAGLKYVPEYTYNDWYERFHAEWNKMQTICIVWMGIELAPVALSAVSSYVTTEIIQVRATLGATDKAVSMIVKTKFFETTVKVVHQAVRFGVKVHEDIKFIRWWWPF